MQADIANNFQLYRQLKAHYLVRNTNKNSKTRLVNEGISDQKYHEKIMAVVAI